jgi:hypothetical protein
MTTYELQHRFNLEVEKYGVIHPVMSTIVQDYLNYAYQGYITEKYDSLIDPQEKFEVTERISRILAPLIADYNVTSFTSITTNNVTDKVVCYYAAGPGAAVLQYIIKESAVLNTTDCDGDAVTSFAEIIPIRHGRITSNINNPFLKPSDNRVWRVNIMSARLELLIPSGTTLASYTCRYLKKQTAVDLDAGTTIEIDSSVHEEIALRAAHLYLADIRGNKENNQTEK